MYRYQFGDGSRPRLTLFLLLSICLHAGLIVFFAVSPRPVYRVAPPLSISLSLTASESDTAVSAAPRRPHPPKPPVVARTAHVAAPTHAIDAAPSASSATEDAVRTDAKTGDDVARAADTALNEAIRAEVQALLLADLQRYFEYPLIARRRGWEGVVRLSVTVEPDGALAAIRIVRSSGYDVLDRSAVTALQRVGQFAQAGERLRGRPLELPLSIVYRLTN